MYFFRIPIKCMIIVAVLSMMYVGIEVVAWNSITSYTVFGEHPEQKARLKEIEKSIVTLDDVAKYAEEYIQKNSRDGVFKYYDKNAKKELELTLDKIHREKLSKTKKDEYFVCADFKGKDGNTYDLDFFVQGKSKNFLNVDKKSISIHKVNGKENYTWNYNEKKGVWEKKTIKTGKKEPEHPKPEYP
ncbi:MAG: hypothetical protein NG747_07240 [Candidatus Brocadia sp.]|nr:hypothetical protein [Candidatus Brocadia sp.]NUO08421.1 hypothetical protein [Candidatus Brocadia sp.]